MIVFKLAQSFEYSRNITGIQHMILFSTVDHILPHQHSKPVTVIIPSHWFNLAMLADHIKTMLLCHLNVLDHRLITDRCQQTLWIISLVKYAILKIRNMIQTKPWNIVLILLHTETTHTKIACNLIFTIRNNHLIQERIYRRPAVHIRDRQNHFTHTCYCQFAYRHFILIDYHLALLIFVFFLIGKKFYLYIAFII